MYICIYKSIYDIYTYIYLYVASFFSKFVAFVCICLYYVGSYILCFYSL